MPERPAGKAFYGVVLGVMLFSVAASFLATPLAIAFPPGRGATMAQALQVVLTIGQVVNPVPAILRTYVPHLLLTALFWLQVALIARRALLCMRSRELVVPPALTGGWKVLLVIGMLSWLLGVVVFLSPILLYALGQSRPAWAMQIANTFFTGVFFIPAANLIGVTYFVVELLSARHEGWLLGKRGKEPAAFAAAKPEERRTGVFYRRAAAVGVTLGLALILVPPLWSLFPTGLVHERLCRERTGERVHQTAGAKSYVLIGEGAGEDGFHLHDAVEDVTSRRVEFVEVVKDGKNFQQRSSLASFLGTDDPKVGAFRVSLGAAGSPDCARRLSSMYGVRFEVQADQCLRFTPIAMTASRYRVEAVSGEWATWYTPHILSYGARVVDADGNVTLGEHLRFARTGLLAFFLVSEKKLDCPPIYGFRPTRLHRKVLLGEK